MSQRARYMWRLKLQNRLRNTARICRYVRARRCSRTQMLYYRYSLFSAVPLLPRSQHFTATYKRVSRPRYSRCAITHKQKLDFTVAHDLQPTVTASQAMATSMQSIVADVSATAEQLSAVRSYNTFSASREQIAPLSSRARGLTSRIRVCRTSGSTDFRSFSRYRKACGFSKHVENLLVFRRRRYFARRVRKMYIDARRKRLPRNKVITRTARQTSRLVVRKANRNRYKGAFGKERRYLVTRDRLQIKRSLRSLAYKKQLIVRLATRESFSATQRREN